MNDERATKTRPRRRGERGIAIVMVAMMLIPLMIFAAFGVDLAAWYARISDLQRAADAAALAGAVWMPDLAHATAEAEDSLRSNGFEHGVDNIAVSISQGSTSTSVRVTVTDNDVDRYFSTVFRSGPASLSRHAEAEYNLPLPLGSPLNYFAGDASSTDDPPPNYSYGVTWPSDYTTRLPFDNTAANSLDCNITNNSNLTGRWAGSTPSYRPGEYGSGSVCGWASGRANATGTTAFPPPDYWLRQPTNSSGGCRVRLDGSGTAAVLGSWNGGTYTNGSSGSGVPCTWDNSTTDSTLFSSHPTTNVQRTVVPQNRPCLVGYAGSNGHWPATGPFQPGPALPSFAGDADTAGNRLCTWSAVVNDTSVDPPNPIPTDRNPGFWAMIYGPGQYAANGDAFSAECTSQFNCSSVQNVHYRATSDASRGEWYVIDVPAGVSGSIDVRVFDASYNHDPATRTADSTEGSGTPDFQTEFRVYEQTNPLDFNVRTALGTSPSNNAGNGGCWWQLQKETGFFQNWATLCTLTGVQPGDRYLVNVRTNTVGAANEAGNNSYAIEAVANGNRYASPGPSIYAHRDMVINNQNNCPSGTCDGVFYLAKVDPNYAGRTLVLELYDAGDSTGAGVSTVYPMMPSPSQPRPVVNVPAADCSFTATPDPNAYIDTTDLRIHTGSRRLPDPTGPDSGDGFCGIRATVGGVRQFNGEWLRIRVDIPSDYTCDRTINNPETTANSCWWGIRYRFNGNASDTTTWRARIEGNPLQLTQ